MLSYVEYIEEIVLRLIVFAIFQSEKKIRFIPIPQAHIYLTKCYHIDRYNNNNNTNHM